MYYFNLREIIVATMDWSVVFNEHCSKAVHWSQLSWILIIKNGMYPFMFLVIQPPIQLKVSPFVVPMFVSYPDYL